MTRRSARLRAGVATTLLLCVAAGIARADPAAPPAAAPPSTEFQGAIRQLALGMTEDAGRIAQLRVALGQAEAQRDAALARVRDLEKAASEPAGTAAPAQ